MDVATINQISGTVVPYIATAASAYGVAVVNKVRDEAADATAEASVGLGRRLLHRLLRRQESAPAIETAVTDLAADPTDEDLLATLRVQVRKALTNDHDLAEEVSKMLDDGGVSITAAADRSIAAHTISGVASTGDNTTIQR
jgi:hypothetical protein